MEIYLFQFVDQIISLLDNNLLILLSNVSPALDSSHNTVIGIDMSIESLRSKGFSEYIFWFLILSLVLFCYIIYLYLPKKLSDLKLGEKIMIGSIIFGVILGVIIGYVQLVEGFLM